jgi:hypothetical protein
MAATSGHRHDAIMFKQEIGGEETSKVFVGYIIEFHVA